MNVYYTVPATLTLHTTSRKSLTIRVSGSSTASPKGNGTYETFTDQQFVTLLNVLSLRWSWEWGGGGGGAGGVP